jgi:hypothetical protein
MFAVHVYIFMSWCIIKQIYFLCLQSKKWRIGCFHDIILYTHVIPWAVQSILHTAIVAPIVIPSLLVISTLAYWGAKIVFGRRRMEAVSRGLNPASRILASLACGWAGKYMCSSVMLCSNWVAVYWSADQGHAVFFLVTCCIIVCVLERSNMC